MISKEDINSEQWKSKRKEIIKRDGFTCCACGAFGKTLNVHHLSYEKDREYWDYPNSNFVTLCSDCHKKLHGHKEGKLKKSISELCKIASKRDNEAITSEYKVEIVKSKKYPMISINGVVSKSYSFAYYHYLLSKSKTEIKIQYSKQFRDSIFGRKSKINDFKSELKYLISLGIVDDFKYNSFIVSEILNDCQKEDYRKLIAGDIKNMDEFFKNEKAPYL